MTGKRFGSAVGCLLLACGNALAQAPVPPPFPPSGVPQAAPPAAGPSPLAAALQPPSEGPEAPEVTNPHMMGDFPGIFGLRPFLVPAFQTISTSRTVTRTTLVRVTVPTPEGPFTTLVPVTTTDHVPVLTQRVVPVEVIVRELFASRGTFKVAEDESPRPQDRVFFSYNFYGDAAGPGTNAALPHVETITTTLGGNPALIPTFIPGVPAPRSDVNREVIGFEKTFLDGNASIELRAPVVEQSGAGAIGGSDFGDVTVVLKYAFLNDRGTGDVLSGGLALTVPTGPGLPLPDGGKLHDVLLQPWAGGIWNFDRFYVQGFTSVAVPTDGRDVTLLCNDVGVGYSLYRSGGDALITAVIPTLEAHVTTPLNHRDQTSQFAVPDLVVLTAGSHLAIRQNALLSLGVAVPVTGPRVFDVEAVVQFNWRF
jgi:hypothetical protein